LSKADEDAAAAGKLLVEGTSGSGVGHSVVCTAVVETGTRTSREVGIGAAESLAAAVVEAAVGTAAVETGTSREVGIGTAESAAVEAAVGTSAVETGTGTSREVGKSPKGAAESVALAVVEVDGVVIREGAVDADDEAFATASGIVKSVESTSLVGSTTSERIIGLDASGAS
jgi:hypothetical protein